MIEKFLTIPEYLNVEDIRSRSKHMNEYLHENILEELRELYIIDIEKFNLVLKELYFRGIGFKKEYQSNFLKNINFEIKEIIKIDKNNNSFKKIDFKFYGLGNFIEDYRISDDRFLNDIPLDGLYSLIPSFKRNLFKRNLEKMGFKVTNISEENEGNEILESPDKFNLDLSKRKLKSYLDKRFFNHFLNYCDDKSLHYLEDINKAILHEYKECKGTREVTYKRVKEKMESLNVNVSTEIHKNQTIYENGFKEYIESTGVSYLEFLEEYFSEENLTRSKPYKQTAEKYEKHLMNTNEDIENLMRKRRENINKLFSHSVYNDIKDIPVNMFLIHFSEYNIFIDEDKRISELSFSGIDNLITKELLGIIENEISIEDYINTFHETLNKNERSVLKLRSDGKTLQFVGGTIGVSRERVRQIEVKLVKKFQANKSFNFFNNLLNLYLKNYCYIDKDYFAVKGINIEIYTEIIYLIGKSSRYHLLNKDTYLLDSSKYKYLEETIEKLSLDDIIIYKEVFSKNSEREREIFTYLLAEKGFTLFKDRYIRNKLTIIERLEYLFREKIKGPLKNNDESYYYLKNLLKKIFNYTVESNRRSLFTRVADTKNVVLVDKNTYMYEDFSNVDSSYLSKLKISIDDELKISPYADPRKIYRDEMLLMKNNEILSYSHLYSIIKNFFNDDYNIGYQNTLYIYQKDNKGKSAEDIILEFFEDTFVVSFDELIDSLGWKVYKLEQLISRLDYLVVNSKKEIINISSIEKEECYELLLDEINKELNKGHFFTIDFVFQIYDKTELYSLLQKYHLTDFQALASFVKKRFEKAKGYWQFLYLSGSNIEGIEEVIPNYFEGIVSKKEISDFLFDKGYAQATVYLIMDGLIDIDLFIPFEKGYLRNMRKEPLSQKNIEYIEKILEIELQKNEIITEKQLRNMTELTEIRNINGTPQLLTFIAEYLGFKTIEAYDGSKYEIPIILSKVSKLNEYDELIYNVVSKYFYLDFSTKKLLRFLKNEYLVSQNNSGIYHKLKGSNLFEFDKTGAFKLLGADNDAK